MTTRTELRALCERATTYFNENPQKHPNVNGHFNTLIMAAEKTPALLDRIDEPERVMGVMAESLREIDDYTGGAECVLDDEYVIERRIDALEEHAKLMEGDDGLR
jgi:hypothetical protein